MCLERCNVIGRDLKIQYCCIFLLFRVMEIHRIDEVTATPLYGRCQPERVFMAAQKAALLFEQ